MPSVNELEAFFSRLPSEKEREYEKNIAKLAERCVSKTDLDSLHSLIDCKSKFAYEAFVCLLTIYRRNKDFELMKNLIDKHTEFKKRLSYNHMIIQYLVHSESFYDYDELLMMAFRDAQVFNENSGYLQAFCNAFATICECCSEEDQIRIIDEWFEDAYECINKALELDSNYAKFYCTKGRILALKGKFAEAIDLINQAIAKENSARPDYALTIMNYQMNKMAIQMRWQNSDFESKLKKQEVILQRLIECIGAKADFDIEDKVERKQVIDVYHGDKSYAFLSYAHKDQAEVYEIISKLQSNDARIWFDKGLEIGGEWPEEIANHLINSSVVLVMLSSNSIQSSNVRREVNLALSENKSIIVVRLDEVSLSPGMKLQFGLYQMVLRNQYDEQNFIELLTSSIQNKLEN